MRTDVNGIGKEKWREGEGEGERGRKEGREGGNKSFYAVHKMDTMVMTERRADLFTSSNFIHVICSSATLSL